MRLMTPIGTTVLLVDANKGRSRSTRKVMVEQGFSVAGAIENPSAIGGKLAETNADIVIIVNERVDDELLAYLKAIPEEVRRPLVMCSEEGASESIHAAVEAGVNAYVVTGVTGNRIRSAIDLANANFSSTSRLKEELDEVRTALSDRKIIERAKGIVMKEKGFDEEEAYTLLRNRAMNKGIRLVDVAIMVTEAAEVLK